MYHSDQSINCRNSLLFLLLMHIIIPLHEVMNKIFVRALFFSFSIFSSLSEDEKLKTGLFALIGHTCICIKFERIVCLYARTPDTHSTTARDKTSLLHT